MTAFSTLESWSGKEIGEVGSLSEQEVDSYTQRPLRMPALNFGLLFLSLSFPNFFPQLFLESNLGKVSLGK